MAQYILGKISPLYKGEWSATETYQRLDVVLYKGSSYICLGSDIEATPDEAPTYWGMIAKAGSWTTFTDEEKTTVISQLIEVFSEKGYISVDEINVQELNAQSISLGGVDIQEAIKKDLSVTVGNNTYNNY